MSLPLEQLMFVFNKNKDYIKITIAITIINVVLILTVIDKFELFGIIATLILSEILFIFFYLKSSLLKIKYKA
jgi:O-antigen/teichoic acid export membrane protein